MMYVASTILDFLDFIVWLDLCMKYDFDVQVHVASSNFLLDVIDLEG
jgi:hypothetical protein